MQRLRAAYARAPSVDPAGDGRRARPGGVRGHRHRGDRAGVQGARVPGVGGLPAPERHRPPGARRGDRVRVHRPGPGRAERRRHRQCPHRLQRDRLVAQRPRPHQGDRAPSPLVSDRAGRAARVRRAGAVPHPARPTRHHPRARPGPVRDPMRTDDLDYDLPPSPDRADAGRAARQRAAPGVRPCHAARSGTGASATCWTSCAPTTCVVAERHPRAAGAGAGPARERRRGRGAPARAASRTAAGRRSRGPPGGCARARR